MQTENYKRSAKSRTKSRATMRKVKHKAQWEALLARDAAPARDKRSKGR
jgi:hypothetical protein